MGIVDIGQIKRDLKKRSMQELYDIAYECIENIGAERYRYVIKEVTNRFIDSKISAKEYKEFNSKVSKKQPDPKNFKL